MAEWQLTGLSGMLYEWQPRRPSGSFNSSDGRVDRASATGAVDSGSIPSRVKPMT